MNKLQEIKQRAEKFFRGQVIDKDVFYDWINTNLYLCISDLCECVQEINKEYDGQDVLDVDKDYLYWKGMWDWLEAIVSTYFDKYIRDNAKKWGATFTEDF